MEEYVIIKDLIKNLTIENTELLKEECKISLNKFLKKIGVFQ